MVDWTIIKILSWTESYFNDHAVDSPRLAAEILLAHSLGIKRLDLYLQHDRPLEKQELSEFKALIKRRILKEPVAYITGEKGFYESDFKVAKGVLIPRPDTETLVETAIEYLKAAPSENHPKKVLELGAGSGAIVVSLAKAQPQAAYFAGDLSKDALDIAQLNAQKIVPGQVNFFCGSWLDAVKKTPIFDLIVSNPPYIPTRDIDDLEPEIHLFEPMLALDGGEDGLDSYRIILKDAGHCLTPGGMLLFETGFDQKDGICKLFKQHSEYESIEFIQDLAGHDRVAKIKKFN